MSAFTVSDKHIKQMALWSAMRDGGGVDIDLAKRNAQILATENHRSVNHRYNEGTTPGPIKIDPSDVMRMIKCPVAQLKAVHCYEYQSCETPDWPMTLAFEICQDIKARAIGNLPGYEEAPWEIR